MTDTKHYTYRVSWSGEDDEFVATVIEFPSLSWLDPDQNEALCGIVALVNDVVTDLQATGEPVPEPIAERHYSDHADHWHRARGFVVRRDPDG